MTHRRGLTQESVFLVCGELTRVASSETRLSQTPLELLGIDLAVLHRTGSDIQSCVTLTGINTVRWRRLAKCEEVRAEEQKIFILLNNSFYLCNSSFY